MKKQSKKTEVLERTIKVKAALANCNFALAGLPQSALELCADNEFRSLSRIFAKNYKSKNINSEDFEFLYSMLLEKYVTIKTEEMINKQLSKVFG